MSFAKKAFKAIDKNPIGHKLAVARRGALDALADPASVTKAPYQFIDRSHGSLSMCMILAGYKPTLWDDVFARLAAALPDDFDVCVLSSGLFDERLDAIAAEHGWSYLSTEVNQLANIQNKAIELHRCATWIYKVDEDIFVTEGLFEGLREGLERVSSTTCWRPAFAAPLLNVNTYTSIRLLDLVGLTEDFKAQGLCEVAYTDGITHNTALLEDARVSRYMWGESQEVLADIDVLAGALALQPFSYSLCPGRFSIGVILFSRATWEAFDHFPVNGRKIGLGDDEEHVAMFACLTGRPILVCENLLAGHLGYGPQTEDMLAYHAAHPEIFSFKGDVK
ncbi:MAG: hypothetical protein Q4D34_01060 [Eggerthellaceae bacterium]|nr:hypothetical protein [Eggerthellaceae bacterium]